MYVLINVGNLVIWLLFKKIWKLPVSMLTGQFTNEPTCYTWLHGQLGLRLVNLRQSQLADSNFFNYKDY